MSEPVYTGTFYDWDAFDGNFIGYPGAISIDQQHVLVSPLGERCFVLDLEHRTRHAEPLAKVFEKLPWVVKRFGLRSPAISSSGASRICAVATGSGWAVIWNLGAQEATALHPDSSGPVNATVLNNNGSQLAMGLGFYPLDPNNHPYAVVELWDISAGGQACVATRRLPGVIVDQLAWNASEDVIVAVTGARDQKRGHITLLDSSSLAIIDIAEFDSCMCSSLGVDQETDRVVMLFSDRIEVRRLSNLAEVINTIHLEGGGGRETVSIFLDEVLLTNGLRINLSNERRWQLTPLPGCTCVLLLDEHRAMGISDKGMVRVWSEY